MRGGWNALAVHNAIALQSGKSKPPKKIEFIFAKESRVISSYPRDCSIQEETGRR